jgi:hypothetical protein
LRILPLHSQALRAAQAGGDEQHGIAKKSDLRFNRLISGRQQMEGINDIFTET